MAANLALLELIKDALGRTWPHFLLKYVLLSASKAKLADSCVPYFGDIIFNVIFLYGDAPKRTYILLSGRSN